MKTIAALTMLALRCCNPQPEPEPDTWEFICTIWPDGTMHFYEDDGPYMVGLETECPPGTANPDPSLIHDDDVPHGPAEAVPVCVVDGWCVPPPR